MQRIVGGVEIEGDPFRRPGMGLDEQIDKQVLDGRPVVADPVVARRPARGRVLLPASGADRRPDRTRSTGSSRSSS